MCACKFLISSLSEKKKEYYGKCSMLMPAFEKYPIIPRFNVGVPNLTFSFPECVECDL